MGERRESASQHDRIFSKFVHIFIDHPVVKILQLVSANEMTHDPGIWHSELS